MRNIISIYLRDMKHVFTNYAAAIVVVVLCILPSLYAWFNIKASWDPYGKESTSGIRIAVVNLDEGAVLNGDPVNIGTQIVDELKKNDQLGWQFVSEQEARNALEEERIYASVTITRDFSASLTSIVTGDIRKGEIIYTINEKMNAIAPKLTDKGVSNLQAMISQTVVETVSTTIFNTAKDIGVKLEEQIPNLTTAYQKLVEIQGKFGEINQLMSDSETGITRLKDYLKEVNTALPAIQKKINSANELGNSVLSYLTTSKQMVDSLAPTILENMSIMETIAGQIVGTLEGLQAIATDNLEQLPPILDMLSAKIDSDQAMITKMIQMLSYMNGLSEDHPFDSYLESLGVVNNQLTSMKAMILRMRESAANGEVPNDEQFNQILQTAQSIQDKITTVSSAMRDQILPQLNSIYTKAYGTTEQLLATIKTANAKLPEVKSIIQTADEKIAKGEQGLAYAREVLPKAEELITELVTKMSEVNTDDGLRELIDLLTQDVAARSDFLANPVTITEETIYPMGTYGTGMTPFYTVLSLWVGILLLGSVLTVEAGESYKSYQIYFGKFLFYVTITIVQALIVSLGDLYLLRIDCKNPLLFVCGSVLTSIAFTSIVYTLISLLGNAGKVIGIILLVLQVAGSGGTFPIQLTPKFFQVLNPYLPFTYCISFAREAIGGVVRSVLFRDLFIICAIIVVSLVIGVLIKKPLNRLCAGFTHRFKESGLSEH